MLRLVTIEDVHHSILSIFYRTVKVTNNLKQLNISEDLQEKRKQVVVKSKFECQKGVNVFIYH